MWLYKTMNDEIPNKKTAKLIRKAEKELEEGKGSPLFDNAKDAIDWLNDRGKFKSEYCG
jgi:hypothetical protein